MFRRRREGKTNYKKRIALLKSRKIRMVVRKTNKYVIVQFIDFSEKGDKTITSTTSRELNKFGFPGKRNLPSAYLAGYLAGFKAIKKGVKEAILDTGLHPKTKGSILFAALKGALDAGVAVPHSEELFPSQDRINGEHLKLLDLFKQSKKKIEGEFK